MSETITAEQIHKDFYGAEERLYVEAIGLSKGSLVNSSSKADRLKKIGFGKAKPIKDDQILQEKRKISGHIVNVIEYFRTYYPHNKFITEAEVKILCEKYGLLLGDASSYTGDMPENNLVDIEKFKLRKEDWREVQTTWVGSGQTFWVDGLPSPATVSGLVKYFEPSRRQEFDEYGQYFQKPRQSGRQQAQQEFMSTREILNQYLREYPKYVAGIDPYQKEEPKKEYEQPAFKICAPKQDFDTRGFIVQDGHKLVYDPIVLQSVSKEGIEGYLIVTAWGDEASDENVVNQKMN